MKTKKLIKNKKGDLTSQEIVRIVLAVIGISILLFLGVKLWSLTKQTDLEKASATLSRIVDRANGLGEDKLQDRVIIESPKDWYLMSAEKTGWGLCEGDFCLCICEEWNCFGGFICKPTEKFILLRNEEEVGVRLLAEKMPFEGNLKYTEGGFYLFNSAESAYELFERLKEFIVSDYFTGRYKILGFEFTARTQFQKSVLASLELASLPIFFRFNSDYSDYGKWEWSPDVVNWMDLDGIRVEEGVWKDAILDEKSRKFIEDFRKNITEEFEKELLNIEKEIITHEEKRDILKLKGANFLSSEGIKESRGIVIFQATK